MALLIKGKPRVNSTLNADAVLWRYLDSAKFLDLLHNKTLYFSRGDQFEDKYEGAFTQSIKHAIDSSYADNNINYTYDEFKKRLRERVFINCWHRSADDSMAMWNLYGRSSSSVAITTTVGKLKDAIQSVNLPYHIAISRVKYVKHWRNPNLQIKPYSNVFSYKTKAYEFEKEVRVIIDRFSGEFDAPIIETGMAVQVNLENMLRSIVVAPEASPWFLKLVEGVVQTYGVSTPVHRSKLALEPI